MPTPPPRPEEIIRGVAHDLVNPLSSLSGFLKLLLDPASKEPPTHRQTRMLVAMDRACTHIIGLLKDVSDLCGIESGAEEHEKLPVDLGAVARKTFDDYEILALHRRIRFTLQIPDGLPAIPGDARLIERFFDALLRTAGRLAPEGGEILLRLEKSGAAVEGTLGFDGESLAAAAWERLFSGTLSAPRPPEGYAALGPALCRRIAVLHGGALEARERPGGGTLFRFRFASSRP